MQEGVVAAGCDDAGCDDAECDDTQLRAGPGPPFTGTALCYTAYV